MTGHIDESGRFGKLMSDQGLVPNPKTRFASSCFAHGQHGAGTLPLSTLSLESSLTSWR